VARRGVARVLVWAEDPSEHHLHLLATSRLDEGDLLRELHEIARDCTGLHGIARDAGVRRAPLSKLEGSARLAPRLDEERGASSTLAALTNSHSAPGELDSRSKYPTSCLSRWTNIFWRSAFVRCALTMPKHAISIVLATMPTAHIAMSTTDQNHDENQMSSWPQHESHTPGSE
jgi:hypothetical protein